MKTFGRIMILVGLATMAAAVLLLPVTVQASATDLLSAIPDQVVNLELLARRQLVFEGGGFTLAAGCVFAAAAEIVAALSPKTQAPDPS